MTVFSASCTFHKSVPSMSFMAAPLLTSAARTAAVCAFTRRGSREAAEGVLTPVRGASRASDSVSARW